MLTDPRESVEVTYRTCDKLMLALPSSLRVRINAKADSRLLASLLPSHQTRPACWRPCVSCGIVPGPATPAMWVVISRKL